MCYCGCWVKKFECELQVQLVDFVLLSVCFVVVFEVWCCEDLLFEVGGVFVEFGVYGVDWVVYQFLLNFGEGLCLLVWIVSGGEFVCVFFVLQIVLCGEGQVECVMFVFDEVDVGIGGYEVMVVGCKFCQLVSGGQLFVVMYLLQVVLCLYCYFKVCKVMVKGWMCVVVEGFLEQECVEEVVCMFGDIISGVFKEYVQELIEFVVKVGG